ncbi:hypothetical protein V3390_09305 [Luteimonas sp. FXH3W]|uniref:Uncharacterized protein n=1 Tax=Aquilutibacter rugosus TaxID=3115820 RepID=A0ABU7V0W0_9GAMM
MSRSRNLKPGFFKNDLLAECDPLTRIFFQGLWCEADREGRLEYRPKRLKAAILPYDDADVDAMVRQLSSLGFVTVYTVEGVQYLQVENFLKHQNPHKNEALSNIPEKHHTSTIQAPESNSTNRADSFNLIPDSLNPSSDADASVVDSDAADPPPADDPPVTEPPADEKPPKSPLCPVEEIKKLYGEILPELPQPRVFTDAHRKALCLRWRENPARQSLDWWRDWFLYVKDSDFLMGRVSSSNGRKPFTANLPWLLKPENFAKVCNEHYH